MKVMFIARGKQVSKKSVIISVYSCIHGKGNFHSLQLSSNRTVIIRMSNKSFLFSTKTIRDIISVPIFLREPAKLQN